MVAGIQENLRAYPPLVPHLLSVSKWACERLGHAHLPMFPTQASLLTQAQLHGMIYLFAIYLVVLISLTLILCEFLRWLLTGPSGQEFRGCMSNARRRMEGCAHKVYEKAKRCVCYCCCCCRTSSLNYHYCTRTSGRASSGGPGPAPSTMAHLRRATVKTAPKMNSLLKPLESSGVPAHRRRHLRQRWYDKHEQRHGLGNMSGLVEVELIIQTAATLYERPAKHEKNYQSPALLTGIGFLPILGSALHIWKDHASQGLPFAVAHCATGVAS